MDQLVGIGEGRERGAPHLRLAKPHMRGQVKVKPQGAWLGLNSKEGEFRGYG